MSKERSEAKLRQLARRGNEDAGYLLALREACQRFLEATNNVDLVLGIDPDADDILNGFMDGAYEDFLPILVKRSCGVENLSWHISPQLLLESAVLDYKRFHNEEYPAYLSIHEYWKNAMHDATSITIDGHVIEVKYIFNDLQDHPMESRLSQMAVFPPEG